MSATRAEGEAIVPKSSTLSTRVATAVALLAIFISALLYLPNLWWKVFLLPVLVGASWEWSALSGIPTIGRWAFCALTVASALVLGMTGGNALYALMVTASSVFWIVLVPAWLVSRWRASMPLLLFAGWVTLVPSWLALGQLQIHPGELLVILGIIWLMDTCAYLAGRAWGRHKLAVSISPGKTWEGVAGGVTAVAVYYVLLSRFLPDWSWWANGKGMILFVCVTAASVIGDLFESWIKRQAGVKDSGTLLPGHGGILDRIDSLTSGAPLAAALLFHIK